jgi:hypothetical protein
VTWHQQAESWALEAARDCGVPVIVYAPTMDAPAAALVILVGPATMEASARALSGRTAAPMAVTFTIPSAGDRAPDIAAATAVVDLLVDALARAGAVQITTGTATFTHPDGRQPRPARTVLATVNVTIEC